MKDKLLQLLNEIEEISQKILDLSNTASVDAKCEDIQSKLSEAKQLLSYPIAEQGKSAEKEKQKFCDELYFDLTQSHDKRMELIEKLWSIKIASQSPIKQEVSEEELENLA